MDVQSRARGLLIQLAATHSKLYKIVNRLELIRLDSLISININNIIIKQQLQLIFLPSFKFRLRLADIKINLFICFAAAAAASSNI